MSSQPGVQLFLPETEAEGGWRGHTFPESVRALVCWWLAGAGAWLRPWLRPCTGRPLAGTLSCLLPRPWRKFLAFGSAETQAHRTKENP